MIRSFATNALVALAMIAFLMPAQAQLVSTGDALALEHGNLQLRIESYLLQDSVAAELTALGVSHDMAMARVANMSPEELELIAGRIDEMPAGAAGVVYILGVVFIVLIVMHFFRR